MFSGENLTEITLYNNWLGKWQFGGLQAEGRQQLFCFEVKEIFGVDCKISGVAVPLNEVVSLL
jgi:hypothetical protein